MASKGWIAGVLFIAFQLVPVPAVSEESVHSPSPAGVAVPADRAEWISIANRYADEHRLAQLLALVYATRAAHPGGEREGECARFTGEVYLIKKQYEPAIAQFQAVIRQFPGTDQAAFAQLGIGEAYRSQNNVEQALTAFRDVVRQYPASEASLWAAMREGNIFSRQGRKDEAIARWREVALASPRTEAGATCQAYIAGTLLAQERKSEAVVEYQRLLDEYREVAPRVELARAHQTIASIAAESGDYDTAFYHRRAVLEEFPDCRTSFESYYEMARLATRTGTLAEFMKELDNDVRTASGKRRAAAMMVLQRLYLDAGLVDKAAPLRGALKGELTDLNDAGDLAHGVFYIARCTSCPSALRAFGSAPATSASPPVFANGTASEEHIRMFTRVSLPPPILPSYRDQGGPEGPRARNWKTGLFVPAGRAFFRDATARPPGIASPALP